MGAAINIGDSFTRLIVVGSIGRGRSIVCMCTCGNGPLVKRAYDLLNKKVRSCGCHKRELVIARATTHGGRHSGTYSTWHAMIQRCTATRHKNYHRYGGRGIRVCDSWLSSFAAFREDMGDRPCGASLDRIDNDGHYEPGNCRWATQTEQMGNYSGSVIVDIRGERLCLSEVARRYGINRSTLGHRFHRGLSGERLIAPSARANAAKAADG